MYFAILTYLKCVAFAVNASDLLTELQGWLQSKQNLKSENAIPKFFDTIHYFTAKNPPYSISKIFCNNPISIPLLLL